ncbi:molybdopterin synthase sulfur carrier subunit [Marinomonas sp. THO17]
MTTINVVFFAALREQMGISNYSFDLIEEMTIGELKHTLASQLEQGRLLLAEGIQSSIDFEFSRDIDRVTHDSKEVAFFPPVTGG